jgi:hypothetical protein
MMSLFSARRIWITTLLRWDLFREGIVERRMHQRNNLSGSLAIIPQGPHQGVLRLCREA